MKKNNQMSQKRKGFTLIEILTAVAIIGILSTIMLANFGGARQQARDVQRLSDLRIIEARLEQYADKNFGRYPEVTPFGYTPSNKGPVSFLLDPTFNNAFNGIPEKDPQGRDYEYINAATCSGADWISIIAQMETDRNKNGASFCAAGWANVHVVPIAIRS